jgi:Protein of unknown function (DUF2480)
MAELINKIAERDVINIDLATFYPTTDSYLVFDVKAYLFKEIVLKEEDFRVSMKSLDWEIYRAQNVLLHCSNLAIIPVWAYMVISARLTEVGATIFYKKEKVEQAIFYQNIRNLNKEKYAEERVIIKGCGSPKITFQAYSILTEILSPIAKSIMYGEVCSTVPIYKK